MLKYVKNPALLCVVIVLTAQRVYAQSATSKGWMEETMYSSGKINVVIGVVSLLLIGLFIYLTILDRKVSKVEKEIKGKRS